MPLNWLMKYKEHMWSVLELITRLVSGGMPEVLESFV
jgi:hypothetical protein